MDPAEDTRRLYHDLRAALSTTAMSLRTLEMLEEQEGPVPPDKRLTILRRADAAVEEAVRLVDEIRGADRTLSRA